MRHCIRRLRFAAAALLLTACAGWPGASRHLAVVTAPAPSGAERYCAWYGAEADGVLYFGQAAFWWAMREARGDPLADLAQPGPQLVGRFDLERETFLPPLQVGRGGERSGVWDVLPAPDGRLFFTTFYESAGAVDPESGEVEHFPGLGRGLNELAPGPGGQILVTRYGSGDAGEGDGELLAISTEGEIRERWQLEPPPGYRMAPKTPAWDPRGRRYWVTTDLLPTADPAAPARHDASVLGPDGRLLERIEDAELQFAARGSDDTVYLAEVSEGALRLRVRPPPEAGAPQTLLVDEAFPVGLDFVQDIQPAADGRLVLTRWSGTLHVVHPDGRIAATSLPRPVRDGLYYTGVLHGDRLCATYCADVTVVCVDAP